VSRCRPAALDRFRVSVTSTFGIPVNADPASQAQSWLSGTGDLLCAGVSGRVPLTARLGVLAHADLRRLIDLGRNCRRGSIRRAWGTEMARLAGDIARQAGSAEALLALQRSLLQPLELDLLAGHTGLTSARELITHVRRHLQIAEA
jgi:hypothetical protein